MGIAFGEAAVLAVAGTLAAAAGYSVTTEWGQDYCFELADSEFESCERNMGRQHPSQECFEDAVSSCCVQEWEAAYSVCNRWRTGLDMPDFSDMASECLSYATDRCTDPADDNDDEEEDRDVGGGKGPHLNKPEYVTRNDEGGGWYDEGGGDDGDDDWEVSYDECGTPCWPDGDDCVCP